MDKVNLAQKLTLFSDYWNPKIVGELNGQQVKLAKFKGEFVWHKHDNEDEMFFVVSGVLTMEFREKIVELNPDEFIIVPRGVEHKPSAKTEEVSIMLFEPATILNTGNTVSELTKNNLEKI